MRIDPDERYSLVPEGDLDRMILRLLARPMLADLESLEIDEWGPDGRFSGSVAIPSPAASLLDLEFRKVEGRLVLRSGSMLPEATFDPSDARIGVEVRPAEIPARPDPTGRGWWMSPHQIPSLFTKAD